MKSRIVSKFAGLLGGLALFSGVGSLPALASSHQDAPLITLDPAANTLNPAIQHGIHVQIASYLPRVFAAARVFCDRSRRTDRDLFEIAKSARKSIGKARAEVFLRLAFAQVVER